jgi:hypothetical protein
MKGIILAQTAVHFAASSLARPPALDHITAGGMTVEPKRSKRKKFFTSLIFLLPLPPITSCLSLTLLYSVSSPTNALEHSSLPTL